MPSRRRFLHAAVVAAGMGVLRRADAGNDDPVRRDAYAIDGEGGVAMLIAPVDAPQDEAQIAQELAAVRASGLSACLLTVGNSGGGYWYTDAAYEASQATLRLCLERVRTRPTHFMQIDNGGDLQRARQQRRLGVIPRFQGAEPLGADTGRIAIFRRLGLRVVQLTHNQRNLVGDGCLEPGNAGLSNFGRRVVEALNAEKLVVDLAHASQRTTAEAIRASKAPVLISHTGCRALADLPRNTGDAELRAMAERGGVAGIIFWPYLRLDAQPLASDVVRHIEHAIQVCGEDHVGIGTDGPIAPFERTPQFEREHRALIADIVAGGYFGPGRGHQTLYLFVPDLNRADRFQVLAALLAARGHTQRRIDKILGGNFARVMGEVWS